MTSSESNSFSDPEVGGINMQEDAPLISSPARKDAAPASDEMVERKFKFVVSGYDFVNATFILLGNSVCLGGLLCQRYQNRDVDIPIRGAIMCIILVAVLLCMSIYSGCCSVYYAVVLLMRRLPEDAALKMKALDIDNNIAVSAAVSCCSLLLSAMFFCLLNEVKKTVVNKLEPGPVWWIFVTAPFCMAFIYSLSVAVMCSGIRRQIIASIIRLHMAFPSEEELCKYI